MRHPDKLKQILTLAALIVIISLLHYSTSTSKGYFHEIYKVLYYIPIILAAFQFGVRGGLATSLIISFIYLPHVIFQWRGSLDHNVSRALEIVLYNVAAYITGRLAEGERSERKRYEQAATELRVSYEKLQRQSDALAEIEEQMRRTDRLAVMGELAASLAHEVRNPLGSIRGAVEILQDDYSEDKPGYEFLQILIKEVDRLNQVIENYLSLARPKSREINEFNVQAAVFSVLHIVTPKARKEKVDIQCRLAEENVTVSGDENRFRQIMLNLLLNSLAAISGEGRIVIESRVEDDGGGRGLELTVADSGSGIPAGKMEDIFKPFYTTKEDGTGLGLPIAKRIADGYKWQFCLESEEGRGTKAILRIPLGEKSYEAC
jgi:signal transduction histidine kinase